MAISPYNPDDQEDPYAKSGAGSDSNSTDPNTPPTDTATKAQPNNAVSTVQPYSPPDTKSEDAPPPQTFAQQEAAGQARPPAPDPTPVEKPAPSGTMGGGAGIPAPYVPPTTIPTDPNGTYKVDPNNPTVPTQAPSSSDAPDVPVQPPYAVPSTPSQPAVQIQSPVGDPVSSQPASLPAITGLLTGADGHVTDAGGQAVATPGLGTPGPSIPQATPLAFTQPQTGSIDNPTAGLPLIGGQAVTPPTLGVPGPIAIDPGNGGNLPIGQPVPTPSGTMGGSGVPDVPGSLPPTAGAPVVSPPVVAASPTGVPSADSILPLLTGGANGTSQTPLQTATTQATLDQLKNPNPYNSQAVQDEYSNLAGNIDADYASKQRDITNQDARRGLYGSLGKDFESGRMADTAVGQRTAKEQLATSLAQAQAQSQGQYQANAINQGQQGTQQNTNSTLAYLQSLMGYGQQAFNNDATTTQIQDSENNNEQEYLLQLLQAGYGA